MEEILECLICCNTIQSYIDNKSAAPAFEELFDDWFRAFCKHMKWKIPEKYQFDFEEEPFPFCNSCFPVLMEMNKLDELVNKILEDIGTLVNKTAAKIVLTENKKISEGRILRDKNKKNRSKIEFCRNLTLQCFTPSVNVTSSVGVCNIGRLRRENSIRISDGKSKTEEKNSPVETESSRTFTNAQNIKSLTSPVDIVEIKEEDLSDDLPGTSENQSYCLAYVSAEELNVENEEEVYTADEDPDNSADLIYADDSDHEPENLESNINNEDLNTNESEISSPLNKNKTLNSEQKALKRTRLRTKKAQDDPDFISGDTEVSEDEANLENGEMTSSTTRTEKKHQGKNSSLSFSKNKISAIKIGDTQYEYRGFTFEKLEDGNYKCGHCEYVTRNKIMYTTYGHIREYHIYGKDRTRRNRFSVTEVSKNVFKYRNDYTYSKDKGRYVCGHCPNSFKNDVLVRQHIRKKHINLVTQGTSGANTGKVSTKRKRRSTESGMLTYIPRPRDSSNDVNPKEYPYQVIEGVFHCGLCEYTNVTMDNLRIHIRIKHAELEAKYVCEECGKGFNFKPFWRKHMESHIKTKEFICQHCGKGFKCNSAVSTHIKSMHVDDREKTVSCDLCDKRFWNPSSLKTHLHNSHHVQDQNRKTTFTCSICGKTLNIHSKTWHMRTHRKDALHPCPQCGKNYSRWGNLQDHMRSHGSQDMEPKHECKVCGKTFKWKTSFYDHLKRKHGNNTDKTEKKSKAKSKRNKKVTRKVQDNTVLTGAAEDVKLFEQDVATEITIEVEDVE